MVIYPPLGKQQDAISHLTPHPFDVCYCGDYRCEHVGGAGACRLGSLCTPAQCHQFRFVRGPSDQDKDRFESSRKSSK